MTKTHLDLELSGTAIEAKLLGDSKHRQHLLDCLLRSLVSFKAIVSFKSEKASIPREVDAGKELYSAPSVR